MPVTGPSQEHAYKTADAVVDDFLKSLADNHLMSADKMFMKRNADEYKAEVEKLRAAVREMFWIDAADSF